MIYPGNLLSFKVQRLMIRVYKQAYRWLHLTDMDIISFMIIMLK